MRPVSLALLERPSIGYRRNHRIPRTLPFRRTPPVGPSGSQWCRVSVSETPSLCRGSPPSTRTTLGSGTAPTPNPHTQLSVDTGVLHLDRLVELRSDRKKESLEDRDHLAPKQKSDQARVMFVHPHPHPSHPYRTYLPPRYNCSDYRWGEDVHRCAEVSRGLGRRDDWDAYLKWA